MGPGTIEVPWRYTLRPFTSRVYCALWNRLRWQSIQRVRVTVEERKRPLSWESAQQLDDSRAELDWLANESRHYTGEWVALDGNRLVAHGPKLAAVKAAAEAAGVSRPFFASVPDNDLPFGGW